MEEKERKQQMIVNRQKLRVSIAEAATLLVAVLLAVGCHTFFAVCPVNQEHVMTCHWAGEAIKALSIAMLCLCAMRTLIFDEKVKIGIDISLTAISILTAFIPGTIISICGGVHMACRSMTSPWTTALCAILAIASLADIILYASRLSQARHHRKEII